MKIQVFFLLPSLTKESHKYRHLHFLTPHFLDHTLLFTKIKWTNSLILENKLKMVRWNAFTWCCIPYRSSYSRAALFGFQTSGWNLANPKSPAWAVMSFSRRIRSTISETWSDKAVLTRVWRFQLSLNMSSVSLFPANTSNNKDAKTIHLMSHTILCNTSSTVSTGWLFWMYVLNYGKMFVNFIQVSYKQFSLKNSFPAIVSKTFWGQTCDWERWLEKEKETSVNINI